MPASFLVPNPENLCQVKVMLGRLTKKMEVEGDGSKIQEEARRLQEFKFREFKITQDILEMFGLPDNSKGREAVVSGRTPGGTQMTADKGVEHLTRDDEVLRLRLDLRAPSRKIQASRRIGGG